jgi:hypothetical protein
LLLVLPGNHQECPPLTFPQDLHHWIIAEVYVLEQLDRQRRDDDRVGSCRNKRRFVNCWPLKDPNKGWHGHSSGMGGRQVAVWRRLPGGCVYPFMQSFEGKYLQGGEEF